MTLAQLKSALGITSPGVDTGTSFSEPAFKLNDIVYVTAEYLLSPPANKGKAIQNQYKITDIVLLPNALGTGFYDSTGNTLADSSTMAKDPWWYEITNVATGIKLPNIHEVSLTSQANFLTLLDGTVIPSWTA